MKFYERHITQVIERQRRRKSTIIVTGPRQVGKTTVLKTMLEGVNYVTLDDPILRLYANENAAAFLSEHKAPLICDEIQKAPAMFDYVKIIVDKEQRTGQYYFTGSHSFNLMKGVSESLAGRAGIIKMLGLSKREINGISFKEPFKPTKAYLDQMQQFKPTFDYEQIIRTIHKGSFPELYKTESDLNDWRDYYSSYLQSYLEKDVSELIETKNMSAFIKFIKAAAALSGEQLNITMLSDICGMSVNTVKSWLSILEMSGHIYLLEPFYNNQNKRLLKTPKIYFLDTGLICYLGGWNTPQQLTSGANWGHIFETYVISEIIKSFYNDGVVNPSIYYYRDKEKNEIDLIIEEGDKLYPVEIKATTSPNKFMISKFKLVSQIIKKEFGNGGLICLYDNTIKLTEKDWIIPINMV